MKSLLIAGALGAALLVAAATANAAVSNQDQVFVTAAAQGGMAEVQAGKLALQKSQNAKVRAFAQTMVTAHTKANNQLTAIVKADGLTPPAAIDQMDQTMADQLSKLSGSAFDSAYLKGQVVAHKRTLAVMQKEAAQGQNTQLVGFAKQTTPVVEMHLAMANKDVASMSSMKSMSSM